MGIRSAILLCSCLLLLNNAYSQKTYIKETEGANDIFLNDLILTTDGNTILSYTDPELYIESDICISKLNERGKVLWSNKYILPPEIYGGTIKMIACKAGDFVALSYVRNRNDGFTSLLIFKADSNGNIKWKKHFRVNSRPYGAEPVSVAEAKDGSLYLVNYIYNYGLYIQKLDKDGGSLWNRYIYTDSTIDVQTRFGSITTTPDNGLVFSTISFKKFADRYYSHLFKISKDGQPEWQYTTTQTFDYYIPLILIQSTDNNKLRLLYMRNSRFKYVRLDPSTGKSDAYDAGKSIFNLQHYLQENAIHAFDNISFFVPSYNVYAFTKDWSMLLANPYVTQWRKWKVRIQKFDSLGRSCPDYELPDIDSSLGKSIFNFTKSPFNVSNPLIDLEESDIAVSIQPLDVIRMICHGEAPAPLTKTPAPVSNKNVINISFRIAPNPVQDYVTITIDFPAYCLSKIEVTDINGIVLKSTMFNMVKGQNQKTIPIADLAAGIYMVKLLTPAGIQTQKIVKF